MMYYTYAHYTADTHKIFYVGKGHGDRAYKYGRNSFWKNIANKHGFYATILAEWKNQEEAFEHEKLLISSLTDMGISLTNLTSGGEGIPKGYKHTEETKRKQILSRLGSKRNEETKQKMSQSSAWRGHTYTTLGFTGKSHSQESKSKMSVARKGKAQSAEHIEKRTASRLKNNPTSPILGKKMPKFTCSHCGKEVSKPLLSRWHNDNCKLK